MARSQNLFEATMKSLGFCSKGQPWEKFIFAAPRSQVVKSFEVSEPRPFIHTLGFSVRERSDQVCLIDMTEGETFSERTLLQDFEIPYISVLLGEEDAE